MPEEAPELTLDTPDAEVQDEGGPEATPADTNWEERYHNLEADHTRAAQEAAQYRSFMESLTNPETQAEALERLGLQLQQDAEDEEDDFEFDDPNDELRQEIDGIKAQLEQQSNAEAEAELVELEETFLAQEIDALETSLKAKFSQEEINALAGLALSMPDEQGLPNVKGAYETFDGAAKARQGAYLKTKRAGGPLPGEDGFKPIDLKDDEARVDAIANAIEAANDAEAH